MRRPESFFKYTVEISPAAWRQMAHLPLETYQRIREELETMAARLRPETPAPLLRKRERPVETGALLIEDHVARYEVDPERRRITLQEISRRSPRGL
ncbi:MAG: type II toxin-antitoxin system RelE family toxin [Archangium sp.]